MYSLPVSIPTCTKTSFHTLSKQRSIPLHSLPSQHCFLLPVWTMLSWRSFSSFISRHLPLPRFWVSCFVAKHLIFGGSRAVPCFTQYVFKFKYFTVLRHHNFIEISSHVLFSFQLRFVYPACCTRFRIPAIDLCSNDIFLCRKYTWNLTRSVCSTCIPSIP